MADTPADALRARLLALADAWCTEDEYATHGEACARLSCVLCAVGACADDLRRTVTRDEVDERPASMFMDPGCICGGEDGPCTCGDLDLDIVFDRMPRATQRFTLTPVEPQPAVPCPTECDSDCDASCHEAHQPPWKRDHEVDVHEQQTGDERWTCPSCGGRPGFHRTNCLGGPS